MILVQTPLRISFAGGGTDFREFYVNGGGVVLSSSIDKYVFVLVKRRWDDLIYINYSKKEIVGKVDDLQHNLVREAMRITGVTHGVEITTLADVPAEGTGLGSSSSTTVGLLNALYAYQGEHKTMETLAKEACLIEVDKLQNPIGKQDQYIAAYGNMQFITFNSDDSVNIEKIQINEEDKRRLNQNLLLFYTGITRQSSSILDEQKNNIKEQMEILEQMRLLTFQAKKCIVEGAFDDFGEILHQGWKYKQQLASKITNPYINETYETARKAGALGGKITGAGGGGFLLLYCPLKNQENVRTALNQLRELPFQFERDGSKVILNYRR